MAVPTSFADLSTTPAANSPAGSENVFPDLDDYIRFINAALASISANTATNGWVSPYIAGTGSWAIPGAIGSTTPNTGAFTTLSSSGLTTANSLTVTNASTFTGVASFTGTPTGAGLTARFATPGPIGSGTASTGAFTTVNASGTITGVTFSGSGASLTSLPAGQLTGDIAAARLTSVFASSQASAGYQTLPTGLILQWGSNAVGSNSVTNVTLPLAFPNTFFQAFASVDDSDTNNDFRVGAGITSLSQIQLVNGEAAGSRTIRWFAIGR